MWAPAGAQVDFVFGYSLPLGSVVSTGKGGVRKVELPFSSPIRDLLVQDLTVKVRARAPIFIQGVRRPARPGPDRQGGRACSDFVFRTRVCGDLLVQDLTVKVALLPLIAMRDLRHTRASPIAWKPPQTRRCLDDDAHLPCCA